LALLCLVALSPAAPLRAEVQAETRTESISVLDAARLAITAGDLDAARTILRVALERDPDSVDARFLLGEVESRAGNFKAAVGYYRQILVDHPELVRVRLDLARALFALHDDEASSYHFNLALAAPDLPATVIANVRTFLAEIKRRKRYAVSVNLGVAPDTNMNVAPAASQVTLFGLPFQLTQESQPHSGVGVAFTANGEYYAPVASDLRWRAGANAYTVDYPGHGEFDDSQLRVSTGPQFLVGRGDVSVLAEAAQRWFGNEQYSFGAGGRIEAGDPLSDRVRLEGYIEGLSIDYQTQSFLNGYSITGVLFTTYGLTSSSFIRLITGAGFEPAEESFFSNHSVRLGAAYQRDFPWGITGYVEPDVVVYQYDADNAAFGRRRHDVVGSAQVSLNKRNINFFGFSPILSYTYTRDDSDIGLFSFVRHQVELGVTRYF
jgi:outer membrane protein